MSTIRPISSRLRHRMQRASSVWTVGVVILITTLAVNSFGQTQIRTLTAPEVDQIVDHLQTAVRNYVFPDIATMLEQQIKDRREQYRRIADPTKLAEQLTADMRAVGHDQHLAVVFGQELGVQKTPTPEEVQHAHNFDRANGYGFRSARRLPGNVGYLDIAYFSPHSDAGSAIAAAMQIVSGTDSLSWICVEMAAAAAAP